MGVRKAFAVRWLVRLILPFLMVASVAAEVPPAATSIASCKVPPRIAATRPDPAGVPTRVSVGLYVLDIDHINDVEQSFTTRFALRMRWKDPRLAALAHCKIPLEEVWNPQTRFLNGGVLGKMREDLVEIDPEGAVTYTQPFEGTLSVPLNLREFPFDSHVLPITIVTIEHGPEEVLLVVDERVTGRADTFSIPDWSIGPGVVRVSTFYFAPQERNFSRFDYEFGARRHGGFYVRTVIFPLMMFIFMSWVVFWLDPSHLGTQVGLSATVMVILVVFQLKLESLLPRVAYSTRTDNFVLGSQILVFLALFETATSGILAARGKHALAQRFDRWSRWVFPASFVVVLVLAFWL